MSNTRAVANLVGAGNVSSWSLFRYFSVQERFSGSSSHDSRRGRRRSLRIEPLESRQLLDASGLASLVSPAWFESVPDLVGPLHAGAATWTAENTVVQSTAVAVSGVERSNPFDWIVQFDTASLAGISSVAETASLLAGGGVDFQVVRGLGLTGQVLVRSFDASCDAVAGWLAGDTDVAGFEQDAMRQFERTSNDPQLANCWGLAKIQAQNAWNASTGSRSVVVGVIDTGVDYTHPDLAANMWVNTRETAGNGRDDDGDGFVDDVYGYNFYGENGNPMDDAGHGTHCAGTIGGVGNNGVGVAGVNWSTSIMALKFLNSSGQGYTSDAVRAVNYATMQRSTYGVNVRVLSNSWGGGGFSSSLQTAIQAANNAGILFVAAAGNASANNDVTPNYPSNYTTANVVAVAATDSSDQLASFSSYGATTVDLAAPGVSIYSTLPNNSYAYYSGTSMATPHVSGVAALAWAVAPNATVAQVKAAILQGADPIASLSGKMVTGGRLNAYNTLQLLTPTNTPPSASVNTPSVPQSGNVAISYTLTDAQSNACSISVQYSTDAGTTWSTASTGSGGDGTTGLTSSPTGQSHTFVWASASNIVNSNCNNVRIRITPTDSTAGTAGTSQSFTVDNATYSIVGSGDFNGDGTSDVLLWNTNTGWVGTWIVKNGVYDSSIGVGYADPDVWTLPGIGDFNGDGTSDVLLRNRTTGWVGAWIVRNGTYNSCVGVGQADPSVWNLPGIGDFNGDGTSDILLQHRTTGWVGTWIVRNGTYNSCIGVGQADPNAWNLSGIGDFNGDGTSDILLQHRTTGWVGAWIVRNGTYNSCIGVGQADPNAWIMSGVGDFDGDGTSDVLLQNRSTGWVGAWIVRNGVYNRCIGLGQATTSTWALDGIGDFDGDGTSDVLLRNRSTGWVGAWLITNGVYRTCVGIGHV